MTERRPTDRPPAVQELRDRILGAAFDAFAQLGYAGTSTLEIATRAKVSKRDLYAQFGSKQGMLAAVVSERSRRMRAPLDLPTPLDSAALVAMLTMFGTTLAREVSKPEVLAVHRLAIAEAERSPDLAQTLDSSGRVVVNAALTDLLRRAQQEGVIGSGDPDDMARHFTGLAWGNYMVRLLLRVADPLEPAEAERRARLAAEALLVLYPPAGAMTPTQRMLP